MGKVVGIDLGTTNSVVAVMEGGKPIVIANSEGMRTTPSVVAFTKEEERLVGQLARRQSVLNPQNTYYGIKRYIGRRYSELNAESKRVAYTIRRDEIDNIRIKCPRLRKEFSPEELSSMVLRKLADEATRYLGETVTGVVITVPAYFNDAQRQATRDAGRIAGLDVLRILNEPTAAALAYGLDRVDNQTILVFDLGGGTFDVSILEIGDGVFEVKATSGDTQLGGNDFDKRIVDWLADGFLEQEGLDLRRDRQSLQRLMEAAEKAKIELSGVTATEINLPFITATEDGPKHLETRMTRSQFEDLCADLVSRLRAPVKQAMSDVGLSPAEIDDIVLVGGSSRMPMVKALVRSLLEQEPKENINPDEAVAIGAAVQAGILNQEVNDILLLDVTPLSVGLETIGGVMKKLIPRNTTIPVRRSDTFSTSENNQTMVEIHVVQGEREMAIDNKSLGRFKLMGIPPAPRGIPQVQVAFDIDANGILQVTAIDKTTGREQGITIQGASNLNEAEINRMVQEAELYADQDRQKRDRIEKRTQAEALTYEAERQLREVALDFGMQFASSYRRRIENLVQELRAALKQDDDRGTDIAQADLRDALYDLQREVYSLTQQDEEETDFFGSIRRTLSSIGEDLFGDDDEDYFDDRRGDFYGRDSYGRDPYPKDSYSSKESYPRDPYPRDSRDAYRDPYPKDSYSSRESGGSLSGGSSRDSSRDSYSRDSYSRDSYSRDSSARDQSFEDRPRDDRDRDDRARDDRDPNRSRDSSRESDSVRESYERDFYNRNRSDRDTTDRSTTDRSTTDRNSDSPRDINSRGVDSRGVDSRTNSRSDRDPRDSRAPYSRDDANRGDRRSSESPRRPAADPGRYSPPSDDDWDDDDW